MLQRMQTIWLLLAAVFSFLTIKFNVYTGTVSTAGITEFKELTAGSNFFILIFTIVTALIALIAVFLYKNRPLQQKLCLAGLLGFIVVCFFYYLEIKKFEAGSFSIFSIFLFLVPVFTVLAMRGIYRDQKLIKSVDRLR